MNKDSYEDIISDYKVDSPRDMEREHPDTFKIKNDMTGESEGEGLIDDYVDLFNDRYDKIKSILDSKMKKVLTIKNFEKRRYYGKDVAAIGIVKYVRDTNNDNKLIEFEDPTGISKVVYTDDEIKEEIEEIVEDEIIGITGQLADDGGIIFGDELIFPDIPRFTRGDKEKEYDDLKTGNKAVLISDMHVGAELFSADKWKEFVKWLNQQEDVRYLLNCGDYIDGVGVYPDQKEELDIESIYEQNKAYSEVISQVRSDIAVINIMGNHEPVRLAEPQPAKVDEYNDLYPDNVYFTSNPSYIEIEGVDFLLYHGASLQLLPDKIPGLKMENPEEVMSKLLKKRHLSPIYGDKVRIAPEKEDYLVIDKVPDVFHTGHVHLTGKNKYNGVINVNTGCWQYQTQFQKRQNIDPDVGYCMVIDLDTKETEMKNF